jgi:hypothetical protein
MTLIQHEMFNFKKNKSINKFDTFSYRWDNLIYIDVQFYINGNNYVKYVLDYLFKEEFLWDRNNKSASDIKEFCCYLIREHVLEDGELCEGINRFSFDFLECK